jgi:tetratricopeptide (TPR) repeat protein
MEAKAAGVQAAQRNDYSQAAKYFGEACRMEPTLKDVCYYQGRALYYSNRFKDALGPLKQSIEAGESQARARSTIAECLEALGRAKDAEREYKFAAEDANPQYKVRLAVFLFRQGRADESIAPLREALKLSPEDFEANLEMGRVLFEQEKLPDAASFLQTALRIRPGSTQAHLLAAKVYQRLGRNDEARQHLKAAQVPEP